MIAKPKKALPVEVRGLSNSERQVFTTCRKKYFWQFVRKYSPMATPTPFLVGTAVHQILAMFYRGEKINEDNVVDIIADIFKPVLKGTDATFLAPDQLEDLEKQRTMTEGMALAYVRTHTDDLKKWKVLKVEEKGHWRVNDKWEMFFTVDALVDTKDGVFVLEHKTAAAVDASYVSRLALDDQVSTYMLGVERAWGIKPVGVIYNVMVKPRIRLKKDEERSAYLERVLALYVDQGAEYLFREQLLCATRDLVGFEKELELFTHEMERATDTGFFYRNTRACDIRGTCSYLSLCIEGEDQAKDRFVVREHRTQYDGEKE